jgi:hAT family C-terminal dimerisation region
VSRLAKTALAEAFSYIALNILSILAMSDEAERVFSGARRTASWERAQIEPETLKRVKHWKRSRILNKIL